MRSFLGAHASCVQDARDMLDALGTLEACAPRENLRVLRVSAVCFFLVAALLLCVHLWFHSETVKDTTLPGFLRRLSRRNRTFSCRSTPRIPSRYSGIS